MNIQGLQKLTLLDFPGKMACTVFTGGCNLRCPFCHNSRLVINPSDESEFSVEGEIAEKLTNATEYFSSSHPEKVMKKLDEIILIPLSVSLGKIHSEDASTI